SRYDSPPGVGPRGLPPGDTLTLALSRGAREQEGFQPASSALLRPSGRRELHQGPLGSHIIKDGLQWHVYPEGVEVALHDIGHQARAFIELHNSVDIRHIRVESGVGRL